MSFLKNLCNFCNLFFFLFQHSPKHLLKLNTKWAQEENFFSSLTVFNSPNKNLQRIEFTGDVQKLQLSNARPELFKIQRRIDWKVAKQSSTIMRSSKEDAKRVSREHESWKLTILIRVFTGELQALREKYGLPPTKEKNASNWKYFCYWNS